MGYTLNIDTSKVTVTEDGKKKRGQLTQEQVQEKLKEFIPHKTSVLNVDDAAKTIKELYHENYPIVDMTLKQAIDYLTQIYEKYGDMPFLAYSQEYKTFYNRTLYDFNVVSKYHLIGFNNRYQTMNIKNERALIFEV